MKEFFNKHSKMQCASTILNALYILWLVIYFYGGVASSKTNVDAAVGAIATALVTPHMILVAVGVIFSGVALYTNKLWASVTACALVFVSTLLMPIYFMYTVTLGVVAIFACVCVSKMNKEELVKNAIQQ